MIPSASSSFPALVDLPVDRVVHLDGADAATVADALDPLPPAASVVSGYHVTNASTGSDVAGRILDECETAAHTLFLQWMPGARVLDGHSGLDITAVRALTSGLVTPKYGSFLADLAEASVLGGRLDPARYSAEVRAAGLARVLASAYGREHVVLAVTADPLPVEEQHVLAAALEWLTGRDRFGIWLIGDPIPAVDRFPVVRVGPARPPAAATPVTRRLRLPAPLGRPHPASDAEQLLESVLSTCDWAGDRQWNRTWSAGPLDAPIRVDLMFPEARCVVEIDGDDHRRPEKFAADRRRDVHLQLAGFAVLRFTNDHVLGDATAVADLIARCLATRTPVPTSEGRPQ
ncbi:endonuclease domain-containing protein [Rhodococcus sp. SJ-3]|uniref:endonuclease domain-containing protein n=1 Tax=Rhodococcus sp. SJ-3 TaxID=3454628 RepID=UPI003F7AD576